MKMLKNKVQSILLKSLNSHCTINCEAQARIGKGWPSRRKASKLKPLPRAYIKVGCHPPTTTTTTHPPKSLNTLNPFKTEG